MSLLCRDQFLKVRRTSLWILALVLCQAGAQLTVLPSRYVLYHRFPSLSMYDTNVFFTPKSQLPAGTQPEDLISIFTPQLNFMQLNGCKDKSIGRGSDSTVCAQFGSR